MNEVAECPSEDCWLCNGTACGKCGAGLWTDPHRPFCDHDVLDRHEAYVGSRDESVVSMG